MIKWIASFLWVSLLCACATSAEYELSSNELPEPSLEKIVDGVWIHKSYEIIEPWGPVLSQGLVVQSYEGADLLLIDTAWTNADTEKLIALIKSELGAIPTTAIMTHAHSDKMGGVEMLHKYDIETRAHKFTNEDAPKRGLIPAQESIDLEIGHIQVNAGPSGFFEVLYPGPGHTRDNVVVHLLVDSGILFGGCLIRPGDTKSLGNTADGDIANWADAVRIVANTFPDTKIIIPSHGPRGGRELLDHTIALAERAAAAQRQ